MTKFLKAASISGAIAVALSLGAVNVIGAANSMTDNSEDAAVSNACAIDTKISGNLVEYDEDDIIAVDEETMEKYNEYFEVYQAAYNKALQEEYAKINYGSIDDLDDSQVESMELKKINAREAARASAEKECEAKGFGAYIDIKLTEDKNSPYPKYTATISVPSIENTKLPFANPPYKFSCTVGDRTAKMDVSSTYKYNYKNISVYITYSDGTIVRKHSSGGSVGDLSLSATADSRSGYIKEAKYSFYMYDGCHTTGDMLECVTVNLVRQ